MPRTLLMTQLGPQSGQIATPLAHWPASVAAPRADQTSFYRTVDHPHGYAMFETLAASESLSSDTPVLPPHPAPGWIRHLCVEVSDDIKSLEPAPVLMVVAFRVPDARRTEVDDWYQQEHAPLLLKADGWLRVRRYHGFVSQGEAPWSHVALHDLRDVAVLDSEERSFARSTAWRARLCKESWFEQAGRWVYERVRP